MRIFPIDCRCKNRSLSIDMTLPKWAIFTMGVYGDFFYLLSDPAEIWFLSIIKNVDTHHVSLSSIKLVVKSYCQTAFDKLI